jgi:hypothetical protein
MQKTKTLLLAAAAIATIALFAAGEAAAFNDEACYGWNYTGNAATCDEVPIRNYNDPISGFKLELAEGYPKPHDGNCGGLGDQCYEWKYQLTTPGLAFVAWFIPDCCTTPPIILGDLAPANLTLFPVGQGEPEVGFGMYNKLGRVLKGTPNNTDYYEFLANTDRLTSSAAIAKVKKYGVLPFEIAVPACFPAPEPSCVTLETGQSLPFAQTYNDGTCEYTILFNEDGECWDVTSTACNVTEYPIGSLTVKVGENAEEVAVWAPTCTPLLHAIGSPGITCVRLRSGALKCVSY